jgi:hypothetical protein
MKTRHAFPFLAFTWLACGTAAGPVSGVPTPVEGDPTAPPAAPAPAPAPAPTTTSAPSPTPPLRVTSLGVAGFLLEHRGEAVLTAPLYTRPSMLQVVTTPVSSDVALVEASLPTAALAPVRAVVSGHAHYDHLMDVPSVMARAPGATLYTNQSGKHILAALAPDRAASCPGPAPSSPLARARVVAADDPLASAVDYRSCPSKRPAGAPLHGTWLRVPGANVRLLPICAEHPDQVGPVHFGAGSVGDDQCSLPARAGDWLEGATLSYLVDFLDPATGAPVYRVYYQDAPTTPPTGIAPPEVLAEKRVDLALLCVGNYDRVDNAPTSALAALRPRYALGGHWEDFFRPASDPVQPLAFTDLGVWTSRATAALPSAAERPLLQNGASLPQRAVLPGPGDVFVVHP